jgi:hypothetical protein
VKASQFQLCKKGEIQDQKIEIEMLVHTHLTDYDLAENLDTLYYSVEIGELYERDKFNWSERGPNFLDEEKRKVLEFAFKMNHIK